MTRTCIQSKNCMLSKIYVNKKLDKIQKMNALQLKLARTALGLTVRQAAALTGVSHETIVRIEAARDVKETTIGKVRVALEAAGVEFIAENGGGPGVRLRKAHTSSDRPAAIPVEELTSESDD